MLIKEITDQRNAARLVGSQFEYKPPDSSLW